jgi:hypothetical protein
MQFLDRCGLETGSQQLQWFEAARAGLERRLTDEEGLPYVVKDPLLWQYLEDVLASGNVVVDALIIPLRDLHAAAGSRVLQERAAIAQSGHSAVARDVWGAVPGGVVYSLSTRDQEAVLARGLVALLECAVRHDIPLVFMGFPGFLQDFDRLWGPLEPVLGEGVGRDRAKEAFEATVDVSLVRVQGEEATSDDPALQDLADELANRLHAAGRRIAELELALSERTGEIDELKESVRATTTQQQVAAVDETRERRWRVESVINNLRKRRRRATGRLPRGDGSHGG